VNYVPDITPGDDVRIFAARTPDGGSVPAGMAVCYECGFTRLIQRMANRGAKVVVNLSNDGWFGSSPELDQMLAQARIRAVENRVAFVRACNTGISCVVDPTGEIRPENVLRDPQTGRIKEVKGTLLARTAVLPGGRTLYAWAGDWLVGVSLLVLAIAYAKQDRRMHQTRWWTR
jgi:apolipoprotein N-acyltransferase